MNKSSHNNKKEVIKSNKIIKYFISEQLQIKTLFFCIEKALNNIQNTQIFKNNFSQNAWKIRNRNILTLQKIFVLSYQLTSYATSKTAPLNQENRGLESLLS